MLDPVDNLLDSVLDQQRQLWLEGRRPSVEELLNGSSLPHDSEAMLDLIYNEIVVREELGEHPSVEEYARRLPHLKEDLELHFEVHRAVKENVLIETRHVTDADSLPDGDDSVSEALPRLNDYILISQLGLGGMGIVYKARHRRLHRCVALKMFQPGRLPSPREILRFRTEAEAIARLQHPNIVQIFEIGECNGLPYLALELAEQGTLAQKLQQLQFKPRPAAELIDTLARAVHHAHEQNIVHRDLKPANVLFTREGTAKITDFGLAKVLQGDTPSERDATRTGEPIGTPRYMAPEQADGRQADIGPATDVYALGTILYECLTGQVPFVASSVVETLQMIRTDEPASPRRLQPAVPRDLETICLACLRKEPDRRYPSAQALADDLQHFLHGEPIHARPTSGWERAWKWCRRRPTQAALAAVGVGLLAAALAGAFVHNHLETKRLSRVRTTVAELMQKGQEALLAQNPDQAEKWFGDAWILVRGEPALADHRVGVAGWLDHGRRAANQQQWKQRIPPRPYDQRRDEALLASLLLGPAQHDAVRSAREAVQDALGLTLAGTSAWRQEREQLVLVDAELVLQQAGPARALARLDEEEGASSAVFHQRRAVYLERLGRMQEANRERQRAAQLPPDKTYHCFLDGLDHLRRRKFNEGVHDFEQVLDAVPSHFTARLFLAVCFLHLKRPAEARVALTACIAQRPHFAWSYFFRSRARLESGDLQAATEDCRRGLDVNPPKETRQAMLLHVVFLHLRSGEWEKARCAFKEAVELLLDESARLVKSKDPSR